MDCTKNRSKTLVRIYFLAFPILFLLSLGRAQAQFSSRFSLSVGEEYTDNLFLDKTKENDFVTFIIPKLSFSYSYPAEITPRLTFSLAPAGHIYARHSELNNFGFTQAENASATTGFTYPYSPRLTFHLSESLRTSGRSSLTGEADQIDGFPRPPTGFPSGGSVDPRAPHEQGGDAVFLGKVISNRASVYGRYLYSPNFTISGGYSNGVSIFSDVGGTEISNAVNVRGTYHLWKQTGWWPQSNIHGGYGIQVIKSREGETNFINNFDIGDDYFSNFMVQLAPTLTLSGSTGLSINTGKRGPRVSNNSQLTLIKIWELSSLSFGIRRGLTGSLGITNGPSLTTSFFSNFSTRLTEFLTGTAGVNYSLYDTDEVNFNTFVAYAGLTYPITTWLQSSLRYSHRFRDAGAGAAQTELGSRGTVHSNSVFLVFTTYFNVWPNPGLSRVLPSLPVYPALIPQAPIQPVDPTQTGPAGSGPTSPPASPQVP